MAETNKPLLNSDALSSNSQNTETSTVNGLAKVNSPSFDVNPAAPSATTAAVVDSGSLKATAGSALGSDVAMDENTMLQPLQLANMVKMNLKPMLIALGGVEGLGKKLGCSNLVKGLPKSFDFEAAKMRFGRNQFDPPPIPSYFYLIYEGLQDATILMLVAAAIVSFVLGATVQNEEYAWIEGVAITAAVVLVLNVQAGTDYSKALTFRRQQVDLDNQEKLFVIREGEIIQTHPRELVVGDVLKVDTGDVLPADGVLIEGKLKMDEAALTGESKLFEKRPFGSTPAGEEDHDEVSPFCMSGTSVMDGRGRMLVVAVGANSVQGQILSAVSRQDDNKEADSSTPVPEIDVENPKPAGDADVPPPKRTMRSRFMCCCRAFCPRGGLFSGCFRFWKAFFTFGKIDQGGTLMEKLDSVAIDVGKLGLIVAFVVFVVLIIRWSVENFAQNHPCDQFAGNLTACVANFANGCRNSSSNQDSDCIRVWRGADDGQVILKFFITAVTILVVAVPEGLPLAVTLALSVAMRRMWRDNNNVKIMESSETMGSATTICSDKTGTLTMNKMTAVRLAVVDKDDQVAVYAPNTSVGTGNFRMLGEIVNESETSETQKQRVQLFCDSCALASEPTSYVKFDPAKREYQYFGNATEAGLLRLIHELGHPADELRVKYPADAGSSLDWGVHSFPFSSSRKRMSWVVRLSSGGYRLFTKGAPSYVLDACTSVLGPDNRPVPITPEIRHKIDTVIDDFQHAAMRTIATAYRDFDSIPSGGWDYAESKADSATKQAESQCTFIAVIGIEDPLRPGVIEAIKKCHTAGVDVRMCTGDALATAIAISIQCGILREVDLVKGPDGRLVPKPGFAMTGAEFDEKVHVLDNSKPLVLRRSYNPETKDACEAMARPFLVDSKGDKVVNQKAFDEVWPKLRVLSRCLPEDKLTLVRGLRRSKVFLQKDYRQELHDEYEINIFPDYQVVAVTGDGTNDAPALKAADVGFAMGIVGTKIAQRACDIILMDDNFASIVAAVKWGRNVFEAISKFIQFQLTVNLVAIVVASIGSFVFEASPLSAVQMLWVNMIMDSLASLALGLEPPGEELLQRPPYGKRRPMISRSMLTFIFGHGLYQIAIIFGILFDPSWLPGNVEKFPPPGVDVHTAPDSVHWTIIFNTFVLMQLANEINARKLPTVERLTTTWGEWNMFAGIHRNPTFIVIVLFTFVLQVIFVQFCGPVFKTVPLNGPQWGFCIGWGLSEFVWQLVVNLMLIAQEKWCTRKKRDLFEFEPEDHIDPDKEEILQGAGVVIEGFEVGANGERIDRPDVEVVPLNETRLEQARQWVSSKRHSQIEEQKIQDFGRSFISRSSKSMEKLGVSSRVSAEHFKNLDDLVEAAEQARIAKEKEEEQRRTEEMNSGTPSKEQ